MNLEQLRTFLEIADVGSFHKAAERLGSTQPTVSSRMKALESALRHELFHRGPSGVTLTAAGHRFRTYAEIAVRAVERGRTEVRLPQGRKNTVTIGIQTYLIHDLGRHLVKEARRALRATALRLEPDYSDGVIKLVASGLADAGIVYVPRISGDLEVERIGTQRVCLAATAGVHPGGQAFSESYIHVFWGDAFVQLEADYLGSDASAAVAVGSPRLALDLILESGGAAYLDEQMINAHVAAGKLGLVPGAPLFERQVYLIRSVREMDAETGFVIELARKWFSGQ